MDPVVHFELPVKDRNRSAEFYRKAFGWKAEMLGPDMGNYTLVATTETDERGFPVKPGAINGGLSPCADGTAAHPSIVIGVRDIQESMRKIVEAGGTVEGEPVEIPGYGRFIAFVDTEGNRGGLMQPHPEWLED